MSLKILAALLPLLVTPAVRADGCKFAFDGRFVPEREQRALLEWADGTETLHVAALSDPTASGSVWVVPVRAAAVAVRAEPVEEFPAVANYRTLGSVAKHDIEQAIGFAAVLDSGLLCCPVVVTTLGTNAAGTFSAVEASRFEKFGMVVTVVSAGSRAEIETYLNAQGVDRKAADLSPLDPYLGDPGYAFVCGWVAGRGEPVTATGMKLVFPSPTLWFPLRPTRAYTDPVETVVYARGFVKPAPGCDLSNLKCEYVYGSIDRMRLVRAFSAEKGSNPFWYPSRGGSESLTRVTFSTDPRTWDRDLELVPGTTLKGTVAMAVTRCPGYVALLLSALIGAALGVFIPWLTIPKDIRRWQDWEAGAATGAAIAFTVWASALVFALWRWERLRGRPEPSWRAVPALAIIHFAVVVVVGQGLIAWLTAGE